jgi:glutathione synthase/RimK-type ligase-like ATP-grasp enzyme/Flp pilus assembly protein TadD
VIDAVGAVSQVNSRKNLSSSARADMAREAATLHRAGKLADARPIYESLLNDAGDDPNVRGLLGILQLQQGEVSAGEQTLRAALDERAGAPVFLRNLNALLATLLMSDRNADARAIVPDTVSGWPAGQIPDANDIAYLISLIRALWQLDRIDAAVAVLDSVLPHVDRNAPALELAGRVYLAADRPEDAIAPLKMAAELDPRRPEILIALAAAQHRTKDTKGYNAATRLLIERFPYYVAPHKPQHRGTIVVVNSRPKGIDEPTDRLESLYFSGNLPSQLAQHLADRYRFVSFMEPSTRALDTMSELPPAHLVYNNVVNGEALRRSDRLDQARKITEAFGLPIINPVDAAAMTTRQLNAERLQGIPGLRVPAKGRYQLSPEDLPAILADIEERFGYPNIFRSPYGHTGRDLHKVDSRDQLQELLKEFSGRQVYVSDCIAEKTAGDFYRKLRAGIVGDEIIVLRVDYDIQWNVHGYRYRPEKQALLRENRHLLEAGNRVLADPEKHLGAAVLQVLRDIRLRIPLDVFGIDFDVSAEGEVRFYEANAAMVLMPYDLPADLAYLKQPQDDFRNAVIRLIDSRMDRRSGGGGPSG